MEEIEQGKDFITELMNMLAEQGVPTAIIGICAVILTIMLLILFVYFKYIRTGGGQLMLRKDMAVKAKYNSDLSASLALEAKQAEKERSERMIAMLKELKDTRRDADREPIYDKYIELEEKGAECFVTRIEAIEKRIGSFQEENSKLSLSKKELRRLRRGK